MIIIVIIIIIIILNESEIIINNTAFQFCRYPRETPGEHNIPRSLQITKIRLREIFSKKKSSSEKLC